MNLMLLQFRMDNSFVMINGLYYDNMYGTLFGAATRPAYTIEHKIKF